MPKRTFATYLHREVCSTSRPAQEIDWVGHSYPYFLSVFDALAERLKDYTALPLRQEPLETYGLAHSREYLQKLGQMADGVKLEDPPRMSWECSGLQFCLPGYEYSLGGLLEAIDRMRAGVLDRAYCVGMGGHHAHGDWGHGYCLLHPQATAVRYAQSCGFKRVLILDWDIHHGDGTQAIFAHDPSVYCLSIHSGLDLYMMKASKLEVGTIAGGEAVGQCNLPLLHSMFTDEWMANELPALGRFYRAAESLSVLEDALSKLPWKPHLLCICSGYDSHKEDCGDEITNWTDGNFEHLTRLAISVAEKANCPILSVHSGGYKLPVAVGAAEVHVRTMAGE
jgi:acetoin utilization deacetylase AcuC-like enzyme